MSIRFGHFAFASLFLWNVASFAQSRHVPAARTSASLDELARQPKNRVVPNDGVQRESQEPERAVRRKNAATASAARTRRPAIAVTAPATVVPMFSGFLGLADNFTAIPPDTEGAVGPRDVVTMLNTQVMIQDRSGAPRNNFPITLNGFWSPLGNFSDTFDPRILYDGSADRWIACAAVNANSATSALLLAVTRTGDPGGTWNYFKIDVGSSSQWGDFPEVGFNANWVAVSMNLFTLSGSGSYISTNVYVFSKADLYQNGTGAHTTFKDRNGEFTPVYDYDNSHQSTLYLMQEYATDFGPGGSAAIRISKIEGTASVPTFAGGNVGMVTIADPWSDTGPNNNGPTEVDFGPQAGTSTKIDTGDSRLNNCLMRNGTIWCAHTVFLPYPTPTRTAAQWFQIDLSGGTPALVQRGRIDDSSNTFFYAYPTIAVNKNNDALIGYTRFSANDYASAGFAIRTATDPPNAMQPGVMMKAGESPYVSLGAHTGSNRWGDFSATVVDPVNDLDFWTIQEYAGTPPPYRTGAFGTWWAYVTAPSTSSGTRVPVFTTQGVVNAASLKYGSVAPGELVAIFGSNLGPATLQTAALTASGFDTVAGGTRVLFDGVAAPMLYSVSGQAGAVAPFRLQQQNSTQVQVEYLGTPSSSITLAVAAAAPAIFTANESGTGQGSILNQDYTVNSAAAPAARGSTIAIYATGGGIMTNTVIDGSIEQSTGDLLSQNVSVRIGGIPATVAYRGAAPGIVQGVVQINAVVPFGITPGSALPIDLTIGAATSRAGVTLAVQ